MRAVERVYAALRDGILDGTYAHGERLGEAELAEALGVSRTPVREALQRLGSEGLVETLPNRGARVRTWSAQEIDNIFDLRALLEGHAAALAASRVTADNLAQMNELCDDMESAARRGGTQNLDRIAGLNNAFHATVLTLSGNALLPALTRSVVQVPIVMRTFRRYTPERLRESMRQHREIVHALAAADPIWAEASMRAHILSARPVLAERSPG